MRQGLLTTTALLVALFVAAGASATPPDQGYSRPTDANSGGPYVLPIGCQALLGGSVTVPAGQPFTVLAGWGAKHTGQVTEWVNSSSNTLSVNGGSPIDMSPYFRGLTHEWVPDGNWSDIFFYQLPALAPGQSDTIVYVTAIAHAWYDGFTHGQPGSTTYTCTVTGA